MVTVLKKPAPAGSTIVCSGGVAVDRDIPPLLCLTRELAVKHWADSIREFVWQRRIDLGMPSVANMALRWAEDPGIYRYAITLQHEAGHRIAEDRFAVVCRVWIGTIADGQALPAEQQDSGKLSER